MKVLKYKKYKTQYKEICRCCHCKLLVDYSDIIYSEHTYHFECPVCGTEQKLNVKNNIEFYIAKNKNKANEVEK